MEIEGIKEKVSSALENPDEWISGGVYLVRPEWQFSVSNRMKWQTGVQLVIAIYAKLIDQGAYNFSCRARHVEITTKLSLGDDFPPVPIN